MKNNRIFFFLFIVSIFFIAAPKAHSQTLAKTITYESLIEKMIDRDVYAVFPANTYKCAQTSSYDRHAKTVDDPKNWFANKDWSHYIRQEVNQGRKELVMLDAQGPGCVVRIWCTGHMYKGNIRIYIDNNPEPIVQGRIDTIVGGKTLCGPPLSEVTSRGLNLYLPIPYQKNCKITFDRPDWWGTFAKPDTLYYQVNYLTYDNPVEIETFSLDLLKQNDTTLQKVQKRLLNPQDSIDESSLIQQPNFQVDLAPGKELTKTIKGSKAIRKFSLNVNSDNIKQALRSTVIKMEFDGQQTVWAPAGDFFGSGVGLNPYKGWWRQILSDGTMTCYWIMPFEKEAKITIKNFGKDTIQIAGQLGISNREWTDDSMYFHSDWAYQYPVDCNKPFDWNFIEIDGKGVLMGDTLALRNPNPDWWGEGDEKIYIDNETFPSTFGTGTEDYYGYAWCTPDFFESPFHAQPYTEGPRNFGHVTNTRSRTLDAIMFNKALKFDLEVWHLQKETKNMVYAATTYWYGLSGAKSNKAPNIKAVSGPVPNITK